MQLDSLQTKVYSVFSNPSFMTYGMIGITTVVLAALTVFDSANDDTLSDEESYVSQLFNTNEDVQEEQEQEKEKEKEQQQETSLLSALTGGSNNNRKKTKKHLKRFRKTHHKK